MQNPNIYVINLDVDSLFTNIGKDETIDMFIDTSCNNNENTSKFPDEVVFNYHNVVTKKVGFFNF